jgi:hypothetical protein
MNDYRHHRVSRDVQVILVPVPVPAAGSPKVARIPPPPAYPRQDRTPWRPATRPPNRAEVLRRFLDAIHRNDEAARDMLRPNARLLRSAP